ncbi:head GIN domain-containing protein, partial [Flavobacterium sp.]|uniref:head GIN domain-containing protein n=1 Tax=Flavobacterium sp. TaxID=239 RepID=UPI0038FC295C
DFNGVKVFDKLQVTLISSTENKIIITGTRENDVEVVNKNGELKLRMPFPKLLSGDNINIQLFYKNIETIEASEGAIVDSDATFKQTFINLEVNSGAQVGLDIDVEKAKVRVVSGGILELSGKANNQEVMVSSGGNLDARKLQTSQTTITASLRGIASVNATILVDAKAKGGGSIEIFGKPKQINKETILGGSIIEN